MTNIIDEDIFGNHMILLKRTTWKKKIVNFDSLIISSSNVHTNGDSLSVTASLLPGL